MRDIYHITIAHNRNDSRIYQRMVKSLSKLNLKIKMIVLDNKGDEIIDNVYIIDLGKNNIIYSNHIIKQIRLFFKLVNTKAILHFHEPILLPLAIILRITGNIVIFDMHENLHLQIITKKWIIPKIIKIFISIIYRKIENIFLNLVNGVTVPQPIMVDMYKNQNKNIISISNFYIADKNENLNNLLENKDYKKLIYSGTVSKERGFVNMLNLMSNLPKEYTLHIAGNVSKDLKKQIPSSLKKNIILHGYLDMQDLKKLYKICGIGLIMFNNIGQYYMSNSLKLFEYMHYGMFIIMPNFGEWINFNKNYNVGLNLKTNDALDCSKRIKNLKHNLLKDISEKNLKSVQKYFIWNREVNKLLTFYKSLN